MSNSDRAKSTCNGHKIIRSIKALFFLFAVLSLQTPSFAQQDPCEYVGSGCRQLTKPEIEGLKERFLGLQAVLPVPDIARWAIPDGVDEAFSMPFIAEHKYGGVMICLSWAAGCFPEKSYITYIYDPVKKSEKEVDKPEETANKENHEKTLEVPAASAQQIFDDFANRIEVDATLLPHPYLVGEVNGKCIDVTEYDVVTIENTPTFLAWESSDGTSLTMVFGLRTCKEAETEVVMNPAKALAPVKSIVLQVSGPTKAEVEALKQKINRKAFEALLGDVVK